MTHATAIDVPVLDAPALDFLPSDWARKRLGDLFEIQQGKALNSRKQSNGTLRPFLRTANVLWGTLDLSEVDQMAFSVEEEDRLALKPGDLLTCEGGDIGRTAVWRGEIGPCFYQNHLHRLRRTRDDVEPEFFMRWMEAALQLFGLYEGAANKTTIPNLSRNRLATFVVPHPPVAEQRAIAAVLRAVQDAKEACERVISATHRLRASLLRHLFTFGPVPLEEADSVLLRDTEVGQIPHHWGVIPLADVARVAQYGLSIQGSVTGRYPILRMNNLQDGQVVTQDVQGGIQYVDLDAVTFERFRLIPGDLLFNRTNSADLVGKTALFDLRGEFVFASYLVRLRLDTERIEPRFANFYLSMSSTQTRLKLLASRGVSQSNINATKLKGFRIPLPPPAEQRQIVSELMAVNRKLATETTRLTTQEALFNSLLQNLMAGKVRLPEFTTT